MKNYRDITNSISEGMEKLSNQVPETIDGFWTLHEAGNKEDALSQKTKELIALGIAVAGHCDGCIGFHTQKLAEMGLSKKEVAEALGVAVYMGGGPSLMYASEAMQAFEQFLDEKES